MSDVVHSEIDGGIQTITLNRPDSLNALNQELSEGLTEALDQAAADAAVRCVVITGAGRAFSSGADLSVAQPLLESGDRFRPSDLLRNTYHPFITRIVEMEKPVIAAVNGIAAGAGASLAYACDMRIASDKAKFFMAFVKIGLIPDAGSNYFLPQLVGYQKALELAMTGDIIDAQTALDIGLVNKVVPADELLEQTRVWSEPFATGPTRAYALTKRSMRFGATHELASTLDYEADLQDQVAMTRDVTEGISAFIEKRAPTFEGR